MKKCKERICSAACVAGGFLIVVGVIILNASWWGIAVMALGGLFMTPLWLPAVTAKMHTQSNYSPFLSAYWNWAFRNRGGKK
jgi:hypothetical protein